MNSTVRFLWHLAASLALALAPTALAGTLKVPSAQFPTIQSAVDAAVALDTIKIAAGHYDEAVFVDTKADLTIRGTGVVEIENPGSSTPLWIQDSQRITVLDLRLIENTGFAGVLFDASTDCTLKDCRVLKSGQAGVWISSGTGMRIDSNRIENCVGVGILCSFFTLVPVFGASDSVFTKNRIKNCGAGIEVDQGNNVISKNRIDVVDGVGIRLAPTSHDCTVVKNRVSRSATAYVIAGMLSTVRKNVASNTDDGHGFHIGGEALALSKCRAKRTFGDGFLVDVGSSGSTIEKCSSKHAGADGFHVLGTSTNFTECVAKQSVGLDLNDPAGGATTNLYTDCDFGTTNLP